MEYDFVRGLTSNVHQQIMRAVDLARLQYFAFITQAGYDVKLNKQQMNLLLRTTMMSTTWNIDNVAAISTSYDMDTIMDMFVQEIAISNCLKIQHSARLLAMSQTTTNINCELFLPACKKLIRPSSAETNNKLQNGKGIYGRAMYQTKDDSCLESSEAWSVSNRFLHNVRMKEMKDLLTESFFQCLNDLMNKKYLYILRKQLLLKYFKCTIWFKFYYYLRDLYPIVKSSDGVKLLKVLKMDCFDQLKLIGYELLLKENDNVDYVIFRLLQNVSDDLQHIKSKDYIFREKIRNALAMEFFKSEFAEFVVAVCDACFYNSKRNRMSYTKNICCNSNS